MPVRLVDTTLREGAQFATFELGGDDACELAGALAALGVDELEVTNPASSERSFQEAASLVRLPLGRTRVAAHLRCRLSDVARSLDAGVRQLHFFVPLSDVLRRASLGASLDEALDMARRALAFARSRCPDAVLRLSAEDAFRARPGDLERFFTDPELSAFVDRWGVADTTGCAHPLDVHRLVGAVRALVHADLEFHGHDDTGCAVANALMAIDAGATHVDTSVLGLGERNGITSLEGLLASLLARDPAGTRERFDLALLGPLAERVAALAGVDVPFGHCLVGEHAFTHKAGVHVRALLVEGSSYQGIRPEWVGREPNLLLHHRLMGRAGLRWRAQELDLPADEQGVSRAYRELVEHPRLAALPQQEFDRILRECLAKGDGG